MSDTGADGFATSALAPDDIAGWVGAVTTMPAEELGHFERASAAFSTTISLIESRSRSKIGGEQLERDGWYRIRPTHGNVQVDF